MKHNHNGRETGKPRNTMMACCARPTSLSTIHTKFPSSLRFYGNINCWACFECTARACSAVWGHRVQSIQWMHLMFLGTSTNITAVAYVLLLSINYTCVDIIWAAIISEQHYDGRVILERWSLFPLCLQELSLHISAENID